MADKVITYKVKIVNENGQVVETLASDFTTLKKSVSDLEKELENTDFGSEQFKDLSKELKNSKGALEEAQSATMSLGEKFAAIPGPIGSVVQGVRGLGSAFKILLANPVALVLTGIVTALTALYKAFTSTKEGGELLAQGTAALGAVMDVLRDTLLIVSKALIKVFQDPQQALKDFGTLLKDQIVNRVEGMLELLPALGKAIKLALSGEFKAAAKTAADAVGKVTLGVENVTDKAVAAGKAIGDTFKEAATEAKAAADITKELQRIDDAQRELNKRRAEQNKLIADAKLKINDENLSIGERLAALEEVRKAEVSLAEQEAALASRRYEAIKAQNALSDSSKEALDAEAAAYVTLQNALLASTQKQKELFDQQFALQQRGIAEAKAVADLERSLRTAGVEDEEQKLRDELAAQREADIQAIDLLKTTEDKKAELKLLAEDKYQAALNKIQEDARKKREADEAAARKLELEKQNELIDSLLELDRLKYEDMSSLTEEDLDQTINLMTQKAQLLLQQDGLSAEKRLMIERQLQLGIRKLTEDTARAQWEAEKLKFQAIANAFGQIAEIAGEQSGIAKVAAVAQATINTYLSATEAYKAVSGIPVVGPALAPIAAAAAVAAGLKTVQKITGIFTKTPEANVPKFAQGGIVMGQGTPTSDNIGAMLSPGESVLTARATQMFSPILSMMNQMGGGARFSGGITSNGVDMGQMEMLNAMKKQQNTPVKAYVTSSQMTNQMMLDRASKSRSLI
jgi:hypothetical protein